MGRTKPQHLTKPFFRLACVLFVATGNLACLLAQAQPASLRQQIEAAPATSVAPGVFYRHIRARTPAGEPWSIHVLEVDRRERSVVLRAVEGRGNLNEMQRELPSRMGAQALSVGEHILAAVNGDFDLPEPFLGIPIGLSVTSGRLWTSERTGGPVLAVLRSGWPIIAVPEVRIELRASKAKWTIASLNKPLGFSPGDDPRLYTREFRGSVKSHQTFAAALIGRLSPPLPLRADSTVQGIVLQTHEATTELALSPGELVVVFPAPTTLTGAAPAGQKPARSGKPQAALHVGEKVKLRIRIRVGGKRGVSEVIGGFPSIVRDGRPSIVGTQTDYLRLRHPRTAACTNERRIIFAVVDGRQPQLSVGMTLEELGELMASLGCTVAMNADGGGSSVMAVALADTPGRESKRTPLLKIVNSPSDGKERGRGNAWLVLLKR
jgi:predicted thioesterase